MTLKTYITNAYGEALQRTTTKVQRLKKQAASENYNFSLHYL